MNLDDVAAWAGDHKGLAIAATGGVVGLMAVLAWRRHTVSGQVGATANDAGNTLIPYGDAESLGVAGLTDAITGLTTTLTPSAATDPVLVGGNASGGPWINSPLATRIPITRTTPVGSRPSETTTTVTTAAPAKLRYTAKAGDTVAAVSARYGDTPTQFLTMNQLPQTTRTLIPGTSYRVGL